MNNLVDIIPFLAFIASVISGYIIARMVKKGVLKKKDGSYTCRCSFTNIVFTI